MTLSSCSPTSSRRYVITPKPLCRGMSLSITIAAYCSEKIVSVDEREIDIEQQQIHALAAEEHERLGSVLGDGDIVAGGLQHGGGQLTIQKVVFDDEDQLLAVRLPRFSFASSRAK